MAVDWVEAIQQDDMFAPRPIGNPESHRLRVRAFPDSPQRVREPRGAGVVDRLARVKVESCRIDQTVSGRKVLKIVMPANVAAALEQHAPAADPDSANPEVPLTAWA